MNILIIIATLFGGFFTAVLYFGILARSSAGFIKDKNIGKYVLLYLLRISLIIFVFYLMIRPGLLYFAAGFAAFMAGRYFTVRKVKNEIFTG